MILIGGCTHYAAVQIETDPPGAEVVNLKNDVTMGTTPFKYWWKISSSRRQFVEVRIQKSGYEDKITTFYINPKYRTREAALDDANTVDVPLEKLN